jgi:hypothetical protein
MGKCGMIAERCGIMFSRLGESVSNRENPVQTAAKISWHFSSLMAFLSLLLNATLHREFKRTVFQVIHKLGRPSRERSGSRKNRLRFIREAKEVVSTFWAVGLAVWAVLGVLGALIGKLGRKR